MKTTPPLPPEGDFRVENLIRDAVPEVLAHQDAGRCFAWMREHIADYMSPNMLAEAGPGNIPAFAYVMGRDLWNVLPLPRNRYRPEAVPEPGRNDPCPCGSGTKYKHCCDRVPHIPLSSDLIWPVVLDAMDKPQREAAVRSGALPRQALIVLASQMLEEHRTAEVVKLLEPLLLPQPVAHDDVMEFAFDTLCDAYEKLGRRRKKSTLIETVLAKTPRSPLRGGAWQRRTVINMDQHDLAAARETFHHAQQDDPEDPALGVLEVELLLAEHKPDTARERAEFFVRQLRRRGLPEDQPPLSFLIHMARDPVGAMSDLALEQAGEAGRGLRDWIKSVSARPLPKYRLTDVESLPPRTDGDVIDSLIEKGIPAEEARRAVKQLQLDISPVEDPAPPGNETKEPPLHCLLAPPALGTLEKSWHEVFPLSKPFSVQEEPFNDAYAWDPAAERRWTAFLQKHPACFDSLDILDDLATAVLQHEQVGLPWLDQEMLLPLLRRAEAIIAAAIGHSHSANLDWGWQDNRPALRSLARIALVVQHARPEEALRVMETLLRLNPKDNHGYRAFVICLWLKRGEDRKAAELATQFPDDQMAETAYGGALALFRLGKRGEADRRLREAVKDLPKVAAYLLRDKVRKPAIKEGLYTLGGDDQAWLYREEMHSVWTATPGALDWLREVHANSLPPRSSRKSGRNRRR